MNRTTPAMITATASMAPITATHQIKGLVVCGVVRWKWPDFCIGEWERTLVWESGDLSDFMWEFCEGRKSKMLSRVLRCNGWGRFWYIFLSYV